MKKKHGIIITIALILLIFITCSIRFYGCNKEVTKSTEAESTEAESNLVLGLSNQSQKEVKLKVYVDDNLYAEYEAPGGSVHQVSYNYLKASSGVHTIKVVANDGTSSKKLIKAGTDKKWVQMNYWNDEDNGEKIIISVFDEKPRICFGTRLHLQLM